MINLAGARDVDGVIRQELSEADIQIIGEQSSTGEVPYTLTGTLNGWSFRRAWYYWVAHAPEGQGLSLEAATELHNKQYPAEAEALLNMGRGTSKPQTYGEVVRVVGHCGCPPPEEWAAHYDADGREVILDSTGEIKANHDLLVKSGAIDPNRDTPRFVETLEGVVVKSVVGLYHIDSQTGLNEFARVVRSS